MMLLGNFTSAGAEKLVGVEVGTKKHFELVRGYKRLECGT